MPSDKGVFELDHLARRDAGKLIEMALREDLGAADISRGVDCTTESIVPAGIRAAADFVSRENGIVSGLQVAQLAIETYAPKLNLQQAVQDGAAVKAGQTIATLSGPARQILMMERTCLNFLCRLSGIASLTSRYLEQVAGTSAQVLDTRKTTPGWRRLEKWAVRCGGGKNHRMGLYDAVMIKDNHRAFYRAEIEDSENSIPAAVRQARHWIAQHQADLPDGEDTIVQVEVDTIEQLQHALSCNPDIILLDNMTTQQLVESVAIRNDLAPQVLLEASGGVNLQTIGRIAQTGVERISIGALTHSAVNFDIGLDWSIESPTNLE